MGVTKTLVVLAFSSLAAVLADVSFVLRDCAQNKATELFSVQQPRVSPYPVPVPGDIRVGGSGTVTRDATGDVSLDVTIERYLGFFWLGVPCVSGVGSCKYTDVCGMMRDAFGNGTAGCPPQLVDNNIPCICPIPAGTYSLSDVVFSIPELSGIWSWLAEGDYRMTGKLIDSATGEELACQHLEVTIVDGHPSCSGFLCSVFG